MPPIRHDYGPRNSTDAQPPRFNPRRMRMHREMAQQIGSRGVLARVARGSAACVDGYAG
eukprot:gene16810-12052_t